MSEPVGIGHMKETLHCYLRVSTDAQSESGHSLEFQRELGVKKAAELGFDNEVHDEGVASSSGDDLGNRPVLTGLMEMVRDGKIRHVFVYEQTRLSRNPIISAILNRDFKAHGVTVHLPGGKYELSSPSDEMISSILQAVGTYERLTTLHRSKLGLRAAYVAGKLTGQLPPLGYRRDSEGYLKIDEDEKEIYLQIIEWAQAGENPYEIARRLNATGVPTKFARHRRNGVKFTNKQTGETRLKKATDFIWKAATVNHILTNPCYYGQRLYKGSLIPHQHPIVDKETWDSVQAAIKNRVQKSLNRAGGRAKRFYLLIGMLTCRKCGSNLCARYKSDEKTYYCGKKRRANRSVGEPRCELRSINIARLDELVWTTLCDVLSDSHLRKEEVKQKLMEDKGKNTKRKEFESASRRLSSEMDEIKVKKQRLLALYLDEKLDRERFAEKDKMLNEDFDALSRELDSNEAQLGLISNDNWVNWLAEFERQIDDVRNIDEPVERQKIIRKYVDRITIESFERTHTVEIHMKFPFVGDRLNYRDENDRSQGYEIIPGGKYYTRKLSPVKKREVDRSINHNKRRRSGRWGSPTTPG